MPNKSTNKYSKHQLYVNNALASARIEGFTPSKELMKDLLGYVQGHTTIEKLIKAAKDRYKTEP